MKKKTSAPKHEIEAAEPRLLFSAGLEGVLAAQSLDQPEDNHVAPLEQSVDQTATPGHSPAAAELNAELSTELIFVDSDTPEYQSLLDDLQRVPDGATRYEVVVLDNSTDGISQITETLGNYTNLSAVHILSHGSDGSIDLGGSQLDAEALAESAELVRTWSNAFSETGDLLIYGCDLAASESGTSLVNTLSWLTGTDVAASDDLTGSAFLGGDWELEYQTGQVETQIAVSTEVQSSWSGTLATFNVDTTADTNDANPGDGLAEDGSTNTSLRTAIEEANALGGADVINLGTGNFNLSLGSLTISSDLTITGAGAGLTVIDAQDLNRVLAITGGTVSISGVTLQNGDAGAGDGGGVHIANSAVVSMSDVVLTGNDGQLGGAIWNDGTLTLDRVTLDLNNGSDGGGLYNRGNATVTDSTISNNTATNGGGGEGGGLWTSGAGNTLDLTNVTISGNSTDGEGGGLYNGRDATLTNVTITNNQAPQGAGIHDNGNPATTTLTNTIVAGNGTPGQEDLTGNYTSGGNNLIGIDGPSTGLTDGVNGDQVGTAGSPIDPLLDVLADNGGATQTHALQTGSTAIDSGTNTGAPTTDQRGYILTDATMDIGAYQYGAVMEVTHISHEETTNKDKAIKSTENYGQTFNYNSGNGTYDTNRIEVMLSKDAGAVTQDITLYLRESWDGPDLASATLSSDDLSTTQTWETFDFSQVTLNDGQTYFFRLSSDATDGKVRIHYENSVGGYGNGDFIDQGTAKPGEDSVFRIKNLVNNSAPTFIEGAFGNWSFDEGSGDSVAEGAVGISTATLGSTTGADANDPTWTSGIFGQALHFDGVNDYVEIADAPGIDISGPEFSASLWVKPDRGPGTEDMFFMKGDRQGIGNVNYYLSWKDTGKMTWAFKSDGGFEYIDMDVTLPTVGEWNHVAVVFDRPTVSIYINGTEYTSSVGTGGTSMDKDLVANDEPLWIGAGRDGGSIVTPGNFSAPFSGAIDELALFDRALTDAEVEAIRTSAPPVVTASSFSINEHSANNTVVGTVVANDPDVGDTLTYAVTAGNTNGAFTIDNNGAITVANSAALDFETNPVFNLTVEATDDGSPNLSDSTVVTITLNNLNDAPVGLPAITGTVEEDQILTADTSGISDPDGLGAFSYQWYRDGVLIAGATNSTYTLADADVGAQMSIAVSYTDVRGSSEGPLVSAQTAAVTNINDAPVLDIVGTPTLTQIDEGDINNAGDSVASIIVSAGGDPITDVDASAVEGIAITWADNSNGSWEYSTDGGTNWIAIGTVSDSAALLLTDDAGNRIRFVPAENYNGSAQFSYRAWDQTDGNTNATASVDVSTNGGNTAYSTATESASISIQPLQIILFMSTSGDVSASGAPGLDNWDAGEVVALGDPNISLGAGTTDGTLYKFLDLRDFQTGAQEPAIDAIHQVSKNVTIGGNGGPSMDLFVGDVLFGVNSNSVQLTGSDLVEITTNKKDLLLFRPDTPGDYSSGTFSVVLDNFSTNEVEGISLVEIDTMVGDTLLQAGTFIYNPGNSRDIFHYTADGVGAGTTTGTTSTLIAGDDINMTSNSAKVTGVDLIEDSVNVGGTSLTAGNILVTLDGNDAGVGNNNLVVTSNDVFYLDVTTTTMGVTNTTSADAYILIDGSDLNLDTADEEITALSLEITFGSGNEDPDISFPGSSIDYTENDPAVLLDAGATVNDPDSFDFAGGILSVDFEVGGTADDRLAIRNEGSGAGQVGVAANTVTYSNVTIGTFNGGTGTNPLVINFNSNATPAIVQAVMRNITYENVSDDPATASRTVRVVLTDGDDGTSNVERKTVNMTVVNDAPAIAANTGVTVAEGSIGTAITTAMLNEGDPDDSGIDVTYTVTTIPANGTLYLSGVALGTSGTFTQADIDGGLITYDHDGTQNLSDSFVFSLADGGEDGAAALTGQVFSFTVTNVNDAPTGLPVFTGTATEDQVLTADTSGIADEDGLGAFSYQWYRDGVAIGGATASTYTLGDADVGTSITVVASYTDAYGANESITSAGVGPVANVNDAPVGLPNITGTVAEDQLLTADTSGISDADGLGAFSYQWLRDGVAIGGATGSTYTLGDADVGSLISVQVSYTDVHGTSEGPLTSAQTGAVANVNDAPTGSVTISGTPTEDEVLTASNSLADADGMGAVSYQWYRDGVAIGGATASTYTLDDADVSTTITVTASYTDGQGTNESVTSAGVGPIANVNDATVGVPTITGTVTEDQLLTADTSGISDADGLGAFSHQWLRDGVAIGGATSSTYTLGDADVGDLISVQVSYTDLQGTNESVTSAQTAAVANINDAPTGSVNISGILTEDQILTASNTLADADGMGTVSYQWYRDGMAIGGATGMTYTLGDADVSSTITVTASYTDGQGTAESVTSTGVGPIANVNDLPVGAPTITGTVTEDQLLTADTTGISDADGLGAFSYQWYRDGVAIGGANTSTYTLDDADVGAQISVQVSYTDGQGTAESITSAQTGAVANVNDLPVGLPTISGTATEDQVLTADTSGISDADGLGAFNYQWYRDGVAIGGATAGTYTLGDADVGTQISVQVGYTDLQGTAEGPLASAQTAAVANVNDAPMGGVSISGTPTEDQVLTASNTLADADGMGAVSYQWYRDGVAIGGATGSTYTLGDADVSSTITVTASYTDGQGANESVTSAGVGPIANVNDAPVGVPTITGTVSEDQMLTADTSGISDADGLGAFSYQWLRDGVVIGGATASTYTLGDTDVGALISVQVSYTDLNGTAESITSAQTAAVANINDVPTGSVTISGTPTEDQTLTAANTLADADGMGLVSYQWYRDGVAIGGATASTYNLGDADVGAAITVTASYTDGQGTAESVTSAGVGPIANVNDAPVGVPTITGTVTEDQLLTADTTGISDADGLGAFSYQWYRDGVAIGGATASTYTLGDADVGALISVQVSYTDLNGTAESVTSAQTAAIANINDAPTGNVTIDNMTPAEGDTLTAGNTLADADGLSGAISYQWYRDGVAIGGATGTTYTTVQADVGAVITVVAGYTDDQGTSESVSSAGTAAVTNMNNAPTGTVTISGTPTEDQTLTASNTLADADGMSPVSYQWYRDGVAIGGATASTYTLGDADVGTSITVTASYTDGQGTNESVTSAGAGPIANVNDAPVAREDRIGLVFDGVDDYVRIGDYAGLNVSASVTMEAWIRPSGAGTGTQIIVNKEGEYEVAITANTGEIKWAFANTDPGWGWHNTGYFAQAGEWTHIAVTYNNGVVNTYADGVVVDTYNGTGVIADQYPAFNELQIGGRENATDQRFAGEIDEVRVWDAERTLLEIQSNMNTLLAGNEAGLLGNWRFDEGSGTTVTDQSVNGHHGTLADGVTVGEMPTWEGYVVSEDGTLNVSAANGVLANDFDIDGDPLTAVLDSGPSNADFFVLNPDGSFTYTPSADFNGIDTFTYHANDGSADSSIVTVTIRVAPANDAPVIASDGGGASATVNVQENTAAVTDVDATDVDLDTLTYSISGGADAALFTINATSGVLSFISAPDFENPNDAGADNVYSVTVQVSDGNGGTDTQTITVNVIDMADGIRVTPIDIVPIGGETLVNTTTTDNQQIGAGVHQGMATDANGNYIVVWGSNLQDGSGWGVYGQRFSADGTAQGGEFLISTTTVDNQLSPTVAMDDAGNFVVTWMSNLQDGDHYGVYAQRFDAAGVAQGGEFLVNTATAGYQGSPTIAMDADGDFVIAWVANGQDPDGSLGIYAQRFDAGGTAQGGEFRVNTYTTGIQQVTSMGMDAAGNFVVIWASENQDGSNYGIFGQRFDANGNALGAEFQVNTTTANSQLYHDVVMLDDGRFVVEYQSRNADSSFEVFMQRYAADGTAVGGEIRVNTNTVSSAQQPIGSITADASGNITVVWNSDADGAGTAVVGQRFDWAGNKLGGEFVVNTTTTGNQLYPEVIAQSGGRFIVAWSGNGAGDADGVFMQRYGLATSEEGGSATFQIVLESAPTGDVTIPISVSDPTEGMVSVGSVTFTNGDWNIPQTVTINGVQDFTIDGDQVFQVIIGAATSTDPNFNGLDLADLTVLNTELPNQAPTGLPTITGTVEEDQVLTADTSGISDPDGLGAFSYQWLRDGVAIGGATASTYTLGDADVGAQISVEVSYTDVRGSSEGPLVSAETGPVANINDAPTGSVTISGTPTEDQVLTASNTLADVDGLGAISYQWYRDGVAIGGATGTTYTLGDPDVGATITVEASYTDGYGTNESVTSAGVGPIANVNDLPVGVPTITGTVTEDQMLTADTSGISDADGLGAFSYQWLRDGVAIGGATGSTYTLGDADVGTQISVQVSFTDLNGTAESVTSAQTAAVANINDAPTGNVTISGILTEDQILTASNSLSDADGMGPVSYQWYRDGVAIGGAVGSSYTLGDADVGANITVEASYVDGHGTSESVTSTGVGPIANINDAPVGLPTITGTVTEDQVLTADTSGISDADGLGTFSYQWYRDGVAIGGATGSTYTLGDADVGALMSVQVSYTDMNGTAESVSSAQTAAVANINDAPTGSVTISGTPTEDQVLTASNTLADADGLGAISYQWYRDGVVIGGATGSTYTLGDLDVGATITVAASYTDGQGTNESVTSAGVGPIANINDAPVGVPVITGIVTEDQVLTADTSGISDADGLGAFSYQWYRDGVAIGGATGSTYTLGDADVGTQISVQVSYTDLNGTNESVTSAQTAAVANINDAPTGTVTIDNMSPAEGDTLTAGNTLADADGLSGVISYQWYRDGVSIGGATGTTYTTVQADVGAVITVVASYTDDRGTNESVTSAQTAAVTNVNNAPTGSVTISGTPTEDQVLTASNTLADADGLGAISYQWYRDGVAIGGATGTTFTLGDADVGATITVAASYTDGYGQNESVTSTGVGPIANVNDLPVGAPTITGTVTEDQMLTAATAGISDADGLGAFSYQWYRDGVAIGGATASTFTLGDADVGAQISVQVSYTDGQGTLETITSAQTGAVANVNDLPVGLPAITGLAQEDQVLTADTSGISDADGLGAFSYQWYRDGVAIGGASGSTYTLGDADVGAQISVRVSYIDLQGTAEGPLASAQTGFIANINDAPTGAVAISGTPTEDQVLTAANTLADADGMGAVSYQWYRDGVAIGGATGTTYTLGDPDVGATITVEASYTDGHGMNESMTSAGVGPIANINDAPVGLPTITGTVTEDQMLTADTSGISDADGLGAFSYQWLRDGVAIGGATASTYTLGDADVGALMSVQVSYTDLNGTAESVTSVQTAAVANINDAPTGAVTIDNMTPAEGDTLTAGNTLADADGLSGAITYQWYRDGVAIGGATGTTYTTVQADVGAIITVVGSYTDDQGTSESVGSAGTAAVTNVNNAPTGSVTISGTPTEDQVLTAGNTLADVDGLGAIAYQWYRDGVAIGGATGMTYTLDDADVGTTITVEASYTDGYGTNESVTSGGVGPIANINDAPTGAVTISGILTEDQVLTASNSLADADGMGPVSYQWYRDGVAIGGATGASYTLGDADVGATITVEASYTDGYGQNESVTSAGVGPIANVNDAPTGVVTISGTPTEDQVLTASNSLADADGLGVISYQWYRDGVVIGGATGSTLTLGDADVGATITVEASYVDGQGTSESVASASVGPIANINDAVVGAPTVTGMVTEDQVLTTDTSGISDADGLGTFNYQWMRDGVALAGATGATHALGDADVGALMSVQVSYTDLQGTSESVTSAQTAAVVNINDAPTGSVLIDNMSPVEGDTLTASNTLADADGLSGPINYQWYRDGAVIGGAIGNTYTTVAADVGAAMTVVASYTDDQGTAESVSSSSTSGVNASIIEDDSAIPPDDVEIDDKDDSDPIKDTGVDDSGEESAGLFIHHNHGLQEDRKINYVVDQYRFDDFDYREEDSQHFSLTSPFKNVMNKAVDVAVDLSQLMDLIRIQINETGEKPGGMFVRVIGGVTLSLSAGMVTLLSRSSAIAAGLMSSVSVMKGFDPLIMMKNKKRDEKESSGEDSEMDEAVDNLFENTGESQQTDNRS